jgi:hypothetical protein
MTKRPLLFFLLLAFGVSWGIPGLTLLLSMQTGAFDVSFREYSPLSYVALGAPALAAFITIAATQGGNALRGYLRRLLQWNVGWPWYAALLLGIPAVNLFAAVGMEGLGYDAIAIPDEAVWALLIAALLRATEGPVEELGWRGFALPLLQRRMSGLSASVVLGLIWGVWHVPALVLGRPIGGGIGGGLIYVFLGFFAVLVAQSVLMTVVYNGTGGSIPMAMLFHWMINWPYPWETGLDLSPVAIPLWVAAAGTVALTAGRKYLGSTHLHTEVSPNA